MSTFRQAFFGLLSGRREPKVMVQGKPRLEVYRNEQWIPLPEAARILYDELDGTSWRAEADRETTPEARLNCMAVHLVHNAPVDGRSPPSSGHKAIPPGEFDSGVIKGGGKYFQRYHESYLTFIDMRVRAEDLLHALRRMKAGN